MPDALEYLLATLLALPDERRATVERELMQTARRAALGELAPDVAHDIANPLFAIIGLTELLLADAEPGSPDAERLGLVRQTALDLRASLRDLIDFARSEPDGQSRADLAAAARTALRLVQYGHGKHLEVEERYPKEPVVVACDPHLLLQAALHLLTGARAAAGARGRLRVEVTADGGLSVSPGRPDALGTLAVSRIAADCGGTLDGGDLRLPLAEG